MQRFDQSTGALPCRFTGYRRQCQQVVSEFCRSTTATVPRSHSSQDPSSQVRSARSMSYTRSLEDAEGRSGTVVVVRAGNYKKSLNDEEPAFRSLCRLYNCSFTELCIENNLDETTPVIKCTVQFLLTDPPYNVRRLRGAPNSDYDVLTPDDMKTVVDVAATLLRPGGHAVIFCTVQQFAIWYKLFCSHKTPDEEARSAAAPTFMVDAGPLIFTDHASRHRTNPAHKSCSLADAADLAIHLKKNGLRLEEEETMVSYQNFGYVRSSFSACKNVIDQVMGPAPGERIFASSSPDGTGSRRLLRPEQKQIALLMELVSRFFQPGNIVVDLFQVLFLVLLLVFVFPSTGCLSAAKRTPGALRSLMLASLMSLPLQPLKAVRTSSTSSRLKNKLRESSRLQPCTALRVCLLPEETRTACCRTAFPRTNSSLQKFFESCRLCGETPAFLHLT